jgi:uncharacterized SAM-binding protein YcdF (DUF218 family)
MSILSKILPLVFLPIGFSLSLMLAGLLLKKRWLLWGSMVVLWLFSMPIMGDFLIRSVEGSAKRGAIENVAPTDAIIVLGGMSRQPADAPLGEWSEGADRFEAGVQLYAAGKAPHLVFTGGRLPWQPDMVPEGLLLARRAMKAGVPEGALLVTEPVGNTLEEARALRVMLLATQGKQLRRIILVTSAYHMQRAAGLFERAGFTVQRFPVDYQTSAKERVTALSFLPDPEALTSSTIALHELMGRIYSGTF